VAAAVRAVPCLTAKGITVLRGDVAQDLPTPWEKTAPPTPGEETTLPSPEEKTPSPAWAANLAAAKEILAKNGITLGKMLGKCGTFGCAFEVVGYPDVVLKLSGDSIEAASAQTVLASIASGESTWASFPALAQLHCVYALARTDGKPIGTFALLQQKLRPLSVGVQQFINAWRYSLLSPVRERRVGAHDPHAREQAIQRMRREIGPAESRQARLLGETMDALDAIGVWWDDLHSGNVMQDAAGNWKIIDLGAGQSPPQVAVSIAEGLPVSRAAGARVRRGRYDQPGYQFYVVLADGRIDSGWEYREDAVDRQRELGVQPPAKVLARRTLVQRGPDPANDEGWTTGAVGHTEKLRGPAPRAGVREMDFKCYVRRGFTRADGTPVRQTRVCQSDPEGRGFVSKEHKPWIKREGKLGGPGYLSLDAGEREQILDHCVKKFGYPSCLGSIQALERSRAIVAQHGKALATDRAYLVQQYGGEGSRGPRVERLPVPRGSGRAHSRGTVKETTGDGNAFEYTWQFSGTPSYLTLDVEGTYDSAEEHKRYEIHTDARDLAQEDVDSPAKVRELAARLFFEALNEQWAAEDETREGEVHEQREWDETRLERGEGRAEPLTLIERSTKVGSSVVAAWLAGKSKKQDNTSTDGTTLWLHGSAIGRRDEAGTVHITTAGYDTVTTRSRLNEIPGVHVNKVRGALQLNGKPWNGSWTDVTKAAYGYIERCGCGPGNPETAVEYLHESKPADERLMGSRVQSILFAKDWYTKDEARRWVQSHASHLGEALEGVDLRTLSVEPDSEDARYWHMRLYDPEQMVEGTWGTKAIKKREGTPVVLIRTAVPRWRAALGDTRMAPRKRTP